MKALQDRIRQLESENQLLEDKIAISESQQRDQISKLQLKLREECEKSSAKEQHYKEELLIIRKQMENAEQEKNRHLEENSNEREQWR